MINDSFLSHMEKKVLGGGVASLSLREKNELISVIANREGKAYSEITDDYLFNHHKKMKIDIFDELCDSEIVAGFTSSNGHHYRTNRDDQGNFFGKTLQVYMTPSILEVLWKTEDAGYISHTREEWLTVFGEGVTHKETLLHKFDTLKTQINNATTEAEIIAITWE